MNHSIESQDDCFKNTKDSTIGGQLLPQLEDKEVAYKKKNLKKN